MHPDDTPTEVIPRVTLSPEASTVTFPAISFPAPSSTGRRTEPILTDPSLWAPPRRWWRRPICWLVLGHLWWPDSVGCLECGKVRPYAHG